MTVVRKFHPEVRLKKLLAAPGGISVSQALERAAEKLEDIREHCLAGIDAKVEQLVVLSQTRNEDNLETSYWVSNQIFAEAGALGLTELSAAAHSLCSLLSVEDQSVVPQAAIAVHVDALRALRNPQVAGDKAACGAVLKGLQGLTSRMAAQKAEER